MGRGRLGICSRWGTAAVLLLCLLLGTSSTAPSAAAAGTGLVRLPLRHRPLRLSQVVGAASAGQRRLQASSVQLQVDSAAWGQGVYTLEVSLGTPSQSFEVVADTGSVLLFVPCTGCSNSLCGAHASEPLNTTKSQTYHTISCLSFQCLTGMCSGGQCVYYDEYADGSTSQGLLVQDTVGIGPLDSEVIFGCENAASGNVWEEPSDGILGLGLGQMSVFSQLVDAQVVIDQFGVCLGPIGPEYTVADPLATAQGSENGAIVFGSLADTDIQDSDVQWTPLVRSLVCWTSYLVELQRITVNGQDIGSYVNVSTSEMAQTYAMGCGAVVLDTGSTFMYVDTLALDALTTGILSGLKNGAEWTPCPGVLLDTPGSNGTNVTCFSSRAYTIKDVGDYFPTVTLEFAQASLYLEPQNYLFQLGPYWPGVYVLGVYDSFGRGTVLGAIALSNNLIVFDRTNMRVGFRNATDCDTFGKSGELIAPGAPGAPLARPLRWVMMPGGLQMIILAGCFLWALSSCFCFA